MEKEKYKFIFLQIYVIETFQSKIGQIQSKMNKIDQQQYLILIKNLVLSNSNFNQISNQTIINIWFDIVGIQNRQQFDSGGLIA